jgi:hypothetical protein
MAFSSDGPPSAGTGEPRPYVSPWLAGFGLGLVLLAAFVLMGRGIGASGAYSSTVAWLVSLAARGYDSNGFLARYLPEGSHPLKAWLVFEIAGVIAGALLSAPLAGRLRVAIEKGPRISTLSRLTLAFAGGALMAFAAARAARA